LLIVGASTRAAAFSAVRAGFRPLCADLFADADLRRFAHCLPVADYPARLADAVRSAPAAPWMYTGALENHPFQIRNLSRHRPLWGNSPEVVKQVRDPANVCRILAERQLPFLEVRRATAPPPRDGRWMITPRLGAAGRGIQVWDPTAVDGPTRRGTHYFQRRQAGLPISALYLAVPGQALLLGVTRQLIGLPELHAPPFGYCGTVAPLPVAAAVLEPLRAVGAALAAACGLQGLFGCDYLLAGGVAWLTEVNPRYTASMEVLEYIHRIPLLEWHRRACAAFSAGGPSAPWTSERESELRACLERPRGRVAGKAILFADRDLRISNVDRLIAAEIACDILPEYADVPMPGTRIGPGEPICTVFADGASEDQCLGRLLEAAGRLRREFGW
jgi:predicted ATP-grasp superfamily ATP-dependent carboligase